MNKQTHCPKSGIKIHETTSQPLIQTSKHPSKHPTNQSSRKVDYYDTPMSELDLNLDNYSLADLFNLFNVRVDTLTEDVMKNAKQITLKMHPDKSQLDPKFFIFFRNAYNRLTEIYEFQNKSTNKRKDLNDNSMSEDKIQILNNLKNQSQFKDTDKFNQWFNENFEKYRSEDPNERGYGDWLKSNDNFLDVNENVSMSNMNQIFEQKKKQVQSLTVYSGIQNDMASFRGSNFSLLNDGDNFSSEHYTDLKQAYTETVIPVTLEDYEKMPKFNNLEEYKTHRENVNVTPIDMLEAMRLLESQERNSEKESQALAYKYAKEAERNKEKQNMFWGALKQLTG
jgi:hypothetical protein